MPKPLSLLITSIGNPSPYQNTFHSAGHTLLQRLRHLFSCGPYGSWSNYQGGLISHPPSMVNSRFTWKGFVNVSEEFPTLWQSGSLMNISGPAVKRAWDKWKVGKEPDEVMLVVLHDELERELGKVTVKTDGHSSAKGHNGIKSIQQAFAKQKFIRIGVGIGRPESREPKAVADYVLRKMTSWEKEKVEAAAGQVLSIITDLQYGTYKG